MRKLKIITFVAIFTLLYTPKIFAINDELNNIINKIDIYSFIYSTIVGSLVATFIVNYISKENKMIKNAESANQYIKECKIIEKTDIRY